MKKNHVMLSLATLITCGFTLTLFVSWSTPKDTSVIRPGIITVPATLPPANLKCYAIDYKTLRDLHHGALIKNHEKLLLLVKFYNINDPATMILSPFYARRHKDYGTGQTPIPLYTPTPAPSTVNINLDNVIIGNSEIRLKTLFDHPCKYFLFSPYLVTVGTQQYLVWNVKAIGRQKHGQLDFDEDLGDSNPTPPGRPNTD
jgi:hypothetical protein